MQPSDRTKVTTFDDEAHKSIAHGVEVMRKAVGSTYGPGGRNVLIQKKYVPPVLTRDGVTVARDIAGHGSKMPDKIATEAAKLVYQASEKTNKTAGDGTSNTVILTAELYKAGYRRIVAGDDPMSIKRQIDAARDAIVKFVEDQSRDISTDSEKLEQIAYISSGDKALGSMIADLVSDVGADGAITISYQNAPNVEVEKVTGYLFDRGFAPLGGQEVELAEPSVLVTQKRMATKADAIPVLELMAKTKRQVILIGDISGAALETIMWALQNQKVECVIIQPPAYGADGHEYFVDIATYTGATLVLEGDDFRQVTDEYLGIIKAANVTKDKAILFGNNTTGNAIADRIKSIRESMKGEVTPSLMEQLEQRLAKLAGKVSIIKVGAATEVEREELFFRVEDAVEACKSALSSGIVAGGATTLLHASLLDIEPFVKNALRQPFYLLMSNAGEDGGFTARTVLEKKYGHGYNLRDMSDKPVDLYKAGIVDATKVILQAVKNSFSVAGALLTTGTVITEVEDETPKQS